MPPERTLEPAVELLERALGYTSGGLASVDDHLLDRPTPCARWTLSALLWHMEDSLDAFLEAATGRVAVPPPARPAVARVEALRTKSCALLGAWLQAPPRSVAVGDSRLDSPLLVGTAALEIAVHGWDVAQSTGAGLPLPAGLAGALRDVARSVVGPTDRGTRFADALEPPPDADEATRLLAFLGRRAPAPARPRT